MHLSRTNSAAQPVVLPSGPSGSDSAEQPALPNVAALVDSISMESLNWLVENFLWGTISQYSLASNGTLTYNPSGERVSAGVKLELLIKLTRERRERFLHGVGNPTEFILSEDQLKKILTDWKKDYHAWMHPDTIEL